MQRLGQAPLTFSLSTRRKGFTGAYVLGKKAERQVSSRGSRSPQPQPELPRDQHRGNAPGGRNRGILTTPGGAAPAAGEWPARCCRCLPGTYNLIWPVERALAIQSRSRVLKGTSTKLTLAGRFLALSGYMK